MSRDILLTRSDSPDMAAAMTAEGWLVFAEPLLTIVPLSPPKPSPLRGEGWMGGTLRTSNRQAVPGRTAPPSSLPPAGGKALSVADDDYDGLVFTSAHGVTAFAALSGRRDLPVYTVGPQTAQVAHDAGFTQIHTGPGNAAALAPWLRTQAPGRKLLHPCGRQQTGVLPAERLVVYDAVAAGALTTACLDRLDRGAFAAALFFSPRTGRIFSELVKSAGRAEAVQSINSLSLSHSVLESVSSLPWRNSYAALSPDRAGMMALLQAQGR